MINQDLINYINQVRAEGKTDQQIEEDLLKVGWAQTDIDEAFGIKSNAILNAPNLNPTASQKTPITKITIIAIVVILSVSGAFGYYKYVYNKPAKTTSSNNQTTPTPASSPTATNKILPSVSIATPPATPTTKPSAPAPVPTPTQSQKSSSISDVFVMQDDGTLIGPGNIVDVIAVATKFYSLYPYQNYYDFLNISSTFGAQTTSHGSFKYYTNFAPGHESSTIAGLPNKLLGFNFLGDTFTSPYTKTEKELMANLWVLIHETGHQWVVNLGIEEGFGDGAHYTKWADTGFVRNGVQWSDVAGGWPWKDNGDGTLTVNNIDKVGFSKLSLYLMGLIPASEVPDLRIVVPENSQDQAFQNVRGKFKIISISDIIAKYGGRTPSYQNSQKDFKMAYILLTKKGETPPQYQIDNMNFIAKEFPKEWNLVTYGKSTINQ